MPEETAECIQGQGVVEYCRRQDMVGDYLERQTEPDPQRPFLETSCMPFEEFMSYSAGDGEQVEVCGLELDLTSVLFKKHSSDGILKDQYLRDKEGKDKETVYYNNLEEGK